MAAMCMGNFGSYKLAYRKYLQEREEARKKEQELLDPQTVWITKRYVPTDLRTTAPVPRHKLMASKDLPSAVPHWIPISEPPLRCFERNRARVIYPSHQSSRCEEWSTLRQILPSWGGGLFKQSPPNWGTGIGLPTTQLERPKKRFAIVNSPMTRWLLLSWCVCVCVYCTTLSSNKHLHLAS